MTRRRLRPAHDPATLQLLYRAPYHADDRGGDHTERVAVTAGLTAGIMRRHGLRSLVDLSCGDGQLARTVGVLVPHCRLWLGDLVAAPGLDVVGPIEDTITSFRQTDVLLCSETLEHLDDPDQLLLKARERALWLVLSTPLDAATDPNPEHYWAWDQGDIAAMLTTAGWQPATRATLTSEPGYYTFQLWACR
jgi:hypothetical protein